MSIGLLILRVVVGVLFIGHGTQKLFGWFGGYGPEGTGGFLETLGYRRGRQLAIVTGLAEAGGGLLLAVGLVTPLAAAAIIGVMVNASIAAHLPNGLWNDRRGYELPLVFAAAATALAFTGPGRWSIDNVIGLNWQGVWWGVAGLGLGIGAAVAALSIRRPQPAVTQPDTGENAQAA